MKYQSQKVALAYFVCALALFAVQVLGGLLAGWIYISPNFLSELLPFNIIRMIHTNALIVWLLLGFFGAAYFLVPEESEQEIYSVKLAYLQLIILMVGTLADQEPLNSDWSVRRLTLVLYPFGVGVMALNVFFASLIGSWIGWPVLGPYPSLVIGAVLGLPATLWFARYIKNLMRQAVKSQR